jgi:RNA polymerase sigma-70 factor (ECF subfamily)
VPLAELLLLHARGTTGDVSATPELEAAAVELVRRARAPWPDIDVSDEVFLRHVGERIADKQDLVATLERLHAGDLYLACACCRSDARAIAAFERVFVSQISLYLSRPGALPSFADEVRQAVRERILVARDELLPRIESYNGRGPLGGWLRMVTTRIATDLRRAQRHDARAVDFPLSPRVPDPEVAYLKERYRAEFERAVEQAFGSLGTREGNVLRLHFLDGLAPAPIAAMHRVSVRTVQRWIVAAEQELMAGVRRILNERLRLSPSELESLLGLVRSQLSVSLH